MKYLPFPGVDPLTKKPEDSGYEITVECQGDKNISWVLGAPRSFFQGLSIRNICHIHVAPWTYGNSRDFEIRQFGASLPPNRQGDQKCHQASQGSLLLAC